MARARSMRHLLAVLIVLISAGCNSDGSSSSPEPSRATETTARSETELGSVRLTVEIDPGKPRLSDEPQLSLTIRAPHGIRVAKPPFGEAIGDFLIRDFDEPLPEADGDHELICQIYTLEPTRAGMLTIAPIAVNFFDDRPGGDGKQYTIESEAVAVEVSTILADEAPTLADLHGAAGPFALPSPKSGTLWWILGAVAVTALIAAVVWHVRRRHKIAREPQRTPRELAYLELEKIVQQNLATTDIKAFYVELTGVVRRFIERSTGVRAPELTTEEFLREIAGNNAFDSGERNRLRDFLEAADLVKFAGFRPKQDDIDASFERAKRFIGDEHPTPTEVAA